MKKINQKDYKFYVLHSDENGMSHLETGWEYRSDAKDFADERQALPGHKYHIFTKSYLKSIGIDPDNNDSWTKFTYYKPKTKTTMLGKTTPAGRAKKRVRKTASSAKKSINKRISSILKTTTKRLNKIVDSAAKQVKAKSKTTKSKTSKSKARITKRRRTVKK